MLKKIIIIIVVILVLVGSNVAHHFWNKNKVNKLTDEFNEQLDYVQMQLDDVGPIVDAYTVKDTVRAGEIVSPSDLEIIRVPELSAGESWILNESKLTETWYKVDINPGTILTTDLLMTDYIDDTYREYDLALDYYPVGMQVGDYIDIRVIFPLGQDYIVDSHKRVHEINADTIKIMVSETERHFFRGMEIDCYLNRGTGMIAYATKYIEPGIQKPADMYYSVPEYIAAMIMANPNILEKGDMFSNNEARKLFEEHINLIPDDIASLLNGGRSDSVGKMTSAYSAREAELKEEAAAIADEEYYLEEEIYEEPEVIEEEEVIE